MSLEHSGRLLFTADDGAGVPDSFIFTSFVISPVQQPVVIAWAGESLLRG
jgi:hypothetical protein